MKRVLVANRGEIAVRVIRACHEEGLETVAVYSEADRGALHVQQADRAVCIGAAPAGRSYLLPQAHLTVALRTGCDAVHPGYGFLSENAAFARACEEHGLAFIGPSPDAIAAMGDKASARRLAAQLGVPVVPGAELRPGESLAQAARTVGFPLMIKAAAGGGGRGIRIVRDAAELAAAGEQAAREAQAAFGDGTLYLERYLEDVRHVEIQVLCDVHGTRWALGERDCSVQRRHQKLLEESPSPDLAEPTRTRMEEAALTLVRAIGYRNAGTVEFLLDRTTGQFHFIEMNTRIQVEHPVTEMRAGYDLVRAQLRIAAGARLEGAQPPPLRGHAIEMRINAEDPARGFAPSPGTLSLFEPPRGLASPGQVRLDTHCAVGRTVPPHYDSLLAKLVVHADDRSAAIRLAAEAVHAFRVEGVRTTLPLHARLLAHPDFARGDVNTRWLEHRVLAAAA
jgi:acetyl-CoA carboxylase biotin carboxylase subunit